MELKTDGQQSRESGEDGIMESHGDDRGGEVRGGVVSEDTRRCEHCSNYRVRHLGGPLPDEWCALNRPLVPCSDYEREPGSDDCE